MPEPATPPRIVLCEDDPVLARWLRRLADDTGVELVAETDQWGRAMELVVAHGAAAIVVDLATVGRVGLRFVRALRRLAPYCEVLVISPLRTVDVAALEAGASAVATPSDLGALERALAGLTRQPDLAR